MRFVHITIAISTLALFVNKAICQSEGINVPTAAAAAAGASTYSCDPHLQMDVYALQKILPMVFHKLIHRSL
jgi:hypothetical protein